MEPILKWAGGKRKLVSEITKLINKIYKNGLEQKLYEPFFGGGSLSFALEHKKTVINDINPELYNLYLQIKEHPDDIIKELKNHQKKHSKEYYYQIRELDRKGTFSKMSPVKKAARVVYLNRTCFNGLYRVNSNGFFNVPIGRTTSKNFVFEDRIRAISAYLNSSNVVLLNVDFERALEGLDKNDLVYFDPPYDYETKNGFVSYAKTGFSHEDLMRLKKTCDSVISKGGHIIVSNNNTKFVRELFLSDKKYKVEYIKVQRHISGNNTGRKKVEEVLIYA